MDSKGFDPTHWSNWLLVVCFIGLSIGGLYISWQWRKEAHKDAPLRPSRRKFGKFGQAKLARYLAAEPPSELRRSGRLPPQRRLRNPSLVNRSGGEGTAFHGNRSR